MLATELPRSDQANLAPLSEYEKIDGFHEKPIGADLILREMELEEREEIRVREEGGNARVKQL